MRKIVLIALLVLCCSSSAFALEKKKTEIFKSDMTVSGTIDMGSMILDAPNRNLSDYAKDYVDIPKGGIDWKTFGKTKEIKIAGRGKDGFDFEYFKPGFPKELTALDGQEVTVKGFMFPLDAAGKQKLFLFGPFPVSCPFHYHVTPALVVEVHADKSPVPFSYDAIVLKGKLELVSKDPENSTFYRLQNAEMVKE